MKLAAMFVFDRIQKLLFKIKFKTTKQLLHSHIRIQWKPPAKQSICFLCVVCVFTCLCSSFDYSILLLLLFLFKYLQCCYFYTHFNHTNTSKYLWLNASNRNDATRFFSYYTFWTLSKYFSIGFFFVCVNFRALEHFAIKSIKEKTILVHSSLMERDGK